MPVLGFVPFEAFLKHYCDFIFVLLFVVNCDFTYEFIFLFFSFFRLLLIHNVRFSYLNCFISFLLIKMMIFNF